MGPLRSLSASSIDPDVQQRQVPAPAGDEDGGGDDVAHVVAFRVDAFHHECLPDLVGQRVVHHVDAVVLLLDDGHEVGRDVVVRPGLPLAEDVGIVAVGEPEQHDQAVAPLQLVDRVVGVALGQRDTGDDRPPRELVVGRRHEDTTGGEGLALHELLVVVVAHRSLLAPLQGKL